MRYREKPKILRSFEAIRFDGDVSKIVSFVMERNTFDLIVHFTMRGDRLYVNNDYIDEDYYLIYENGKYRILHREVFEEMYESVEGERIQ